jgi:RHS repeat-associated protein
MSYNVAGQVTGLTLGNGVVESYGYDANRLQLTTQTATKGATSLMNLTYNYQATAGQMGAGSTAGNAGQLMSISGTINSTTESAAYTYDLLGRLVTSDQTSNGSSAQRLFEYDRWGNRTAVYNGLPGGKTPPTQIQSLQLQQSGGVPTNRITSVTNSGSTVNYVYDAAGNVTNDGAHAYTYDAENRVVNVDGGVTAQYKYDYQKRRVTKTVGSSWTHYIWEGAQVIGEHDATTPVSGYGQPPYQEQSARLDYVYAGARMIRSRQRTSSTAPWTTRYYLSDRLSVRMTLDSSGNVLGRQAHFPFGEDFAESGTQEKHHFATYERDGESGTDYAVSRQYAPGLGRFNRPDPLASTGTKESPKTWNRYTYTTGDPINQKDPWGLFSCIACDRPYNPCGLFGPLVLLDGTEMFWNGFCFDAPARPEPEPDPEPDQCDFAVQAFERHYKSYQEAVTKSYEFFMSKARRFGQNVATLFQEFWDKRVDLVENEKPIDPSALRNMGSRVGQAFIDAGAKYNDVIHFPKYENRLIDSAKAGQRAMQEVQRKCAQRLATDADFKKWFDSYKRGVEDDLQILQSFFGGLQEKLDSLPPD